MNEKQRERLREVLDTKAQLQAERDASSVTDHERQLLAPEEDQDSLSVRAKSSGHGKKTADKWNQ
jgi:uncharacterized membrane protein affecting hemolysin expression